MWPIVAGNNLDAHEEKRRILGCELMKKLYMIKELKWS